MNWIGLILQRKKVMNMSKKDNQHRDSTTDFFLKFITKEKTEDKKDNKKEEGHRGISEEFISPKEKLIKGLFKLVNLVNSTLDKMLQSTLSIKILSFVLAVILLFTVSGGSFDSVLSTPNGGDYIKDVPVKIEGLQDDYDVVGMPESVSVALIGPSIDIYTTKLSRNYEVYVDLSGLGEGEQTVELKYRNIPSSLEVMIVPQTVTVTITRKVTKTFDLSYQFINEDQMDKKYSVSVDSIEHNEVEIRGSQDNIDKVYSVKALIDLSGIDDSFSQECTVKAYDRSGKALNVEIIPSTVEVDCSVSSYSKTVPLVPEYTGTLASGFGIEQVEFSETEVKIYGNESKLKNISNVKVQIDIQDLAASRTFKDLKLVKEDGINKMSFDKVDGEVTVTTAISKTISDIPITIKNNDKDYQVRLNDEDKATITFEGAQSVIENLKPEDVSVYVDVKNLKIGRHTAPLVVELDNKSIHYTIDSANEMNITIKK